MIKITRDITKINYTKGNGGRKYIVIHYTGNKTDTAKANANYFRSEKRPASAHYFVDETSIYQVVEESDTAWGVGVNYGKNNMFAKVKNRNSLQIEMCSTGGKIADKTLDNVVDLVKMLMSKYKIPVENVVRHYDVCSKRCPGWTGWIPSNETIWKAFKARLAGKTESKPATPASKPAASTPKCPYSEPTYYVQLGTIGNGAKWVQWHLNRLGYDIGKTGVDGIVGTKTLAAIKAFQKAKKIAVDGIVGPVTRAKIKAS